MMLYYVYLLGTLLMGLFPTLEDCETARGFWIKHESIHVSECFAVELPDVWEEL